MSVAWAPKLYLEMDQEPTVHKPPYLAHLIPADEKQGIVIDCSGSDCANEAKFWVSCGGLRQSLCTDCETLAHARWKVEA
jgi:hypothetical protein